MANDDKKNPEWKWLYSEEAPGGRLFEMDQNPKGWVDTPAKLKSVKVDGDSA